MENNLSALFIVTLVAVTAPLVSDRKKYLLQLFDPALTSKARRT